MSTKERIPIVKLLEERIKFTSQEDNFNLIHRDFITNYGTGSQGVWEYHKSIDPSLVYTAGILFARDPVTKGRIIICKVESEPCTHEGRVITSFLFEGG